MAMLQSTLDQLRARLEAALQISDPRDEEWVALTNPVDLDGSISESARNKIVMMLVGLQSDPTVGNFPATNPAAGARVTPPLHLNAFVLLLANFTGGNYRTGLRMIARTIAFLHQNPIFLPDPLSGEPAGVGNIVLDFVSLDLEQTSDLMAMLGLKYLPLALYRMKNVGLYETVAGASGRRNACANE
jgi:hypothetical protein